MDLFLKHGCHSSSVHQKGLRVSCASSTALAFPTLLHFIFTELQIRILHKILNMSGL